MVPFEIVNLIASVKAFEQIKAQTKLQEFAVGGFWEGFVGSLQRHGEEKVSRTGFCGQNGPSPHWGDRPQISAPFSRTKGINIFEHLVLPDAVLSNHH